jgi:hypothetical protein
MTFIALSQFLRSIRGGITKPHSRATDILKKRVSAFGEFGLGSADSTFPLAFENTNLHAGALVFQNFDGHNHQHPRREAKSASYTVALHIPIIVRTSQRDYFHKGNKALDADRIFKLLVSVVIPLQHLPNNF